ncbi:UDP-N-acetylmuramate dehydrogenase [Sphingobacterium hungaricum]|uniref:UDP-N-acetylenolpyruvoylglucosamine reductase n=1 Tax=Sphingobacterium hungaricum TaxID=2082723 RepID=A0A928V3F9_9SPHI|nr:UDP-N-acetylmuramate dehydrogenase [Sphingobacterium hungaricum]MBE8715414.1 UDP-N-acetylenolpyruvoylglucosamine reductase [Sphingobacterium hungaricum]
MEYKVIQNASLKAYNTFGVDVQAQHLIRIDEEIQFTQLFQNEIFKQKYFVLGGGSNVLFTKDFDGTILKINLKGIQHFIEGSNAYITAAAGEIWNDFVWYCIDHQFPGTENMALIPGTVGASPVQNIGAYGAELMDIFYSCRAFDTLEGMFVTFNREDCGFTYRDSIFKSVHKDRYIITSVTFKLYLQKAVNTTYGAIQSELDLRNIAQPTIKDVAEVVSHIRVEKLPDPSMIGNAGSFFKNPIIAVEEFQRIQSAYPNVVHYPINDKEEKLAAGWLIEQCGWKGKAIGEVAVWKNQALVITNLGNASGKEIFDVSSKIVNDVHQKFGITLEREVNIL